MTPTPVRTYSLREPSHLDSNVSLHDAGLFVHWLLGDMAAFPQHPWDRRQGQWTFDGESYASAALDPTDRTADADPTGAFWEDMSKDECGDELAVLLMELKFQAKPVTAKHACLIAFWATRGGCLGKTLNGLSFSPTDQSGHY